jgi:hypothetical protein
LVSDIKEEHGLRMSEDRMLRRTLGHKRVEIIGGRRKRHNGELHNLYSCSDIIRKIRLKGM